MCVSNTEFEYGNFVDRSGNIKQNEHKKSNLNQKSKENLNQKTLVPQKLVNKIPSEKTEAKVIASQKKISGKAKSKRIDSKKALKNKNDKRFNVKYSIGIKLISIISAIVIISLGLITFLVSYYISADTRVNAENNNFVINKRTSSDCSNRINSIISSVGMFYDLVDSANNDENEINKNASMFFERNSDVIAVYFKDREEPFVNKKFLIANEIESVAVRNYFVQEEEFVGSEYRIRNAMPYFGQPVIALFYPLYNSGSNEEAGVLFSAESLSETFGTGSLNSSFLVDEEGKIVLHPDVDLQKSATDFSEHVLVQEMLSSSNTSKQVSFTDKDGIEYIGAYSKIPFGNCGVITEVQTAIVLEAVNKTTRQNIYLTLAILSFAILIIWIFARSLSTPLKNLTEVANEINSGNFETDLLDQLTTKRRDEVGVLIHSTKAEQDILNTFTRLTNKGVTKAIVRKEIDFDPHLKDITIFFSDIRGFTAISDGFNKRFGEKSAGEIINFLNDYMSRMVNCITISGGTVDKFEGDAIMACWGVLRDENLDFEKLPDSDPRKKELRRRHMIHIKRDALNAVRGTLAMRYALMLYNKEAAAFTKAHENEPKAKYKPPIRIGSGLNSGRATVGFMGSYDKMEFTSIGDAVNLASRTEASNKPCGTDMLITEDTYRLLRDFIRCPENNYTIRPECEPNEIIVEVIPVMFEVKGKGKQHFYGVVNMPNFDIEEFFKKSDPDFKLDPDCEKAIGPKGPKTLNEVRNMLGIPIPDFSGVNLDEEENKIKIS